MKYYGVEYAVGPDFPNGWPTGPDLFTSRPDIIHRFNDRKTRDRWVNQRPQREALLAHHIAVRRVNRFRDTYFHDFDMFGIVLNDHS